MDTEYSNEQLKKDDLIRLKEIALETLQTKVYLAPVAGLYAERLIMLTLCQGAAQNYLYGTQNENGRGVKDLDVWAFYRGGLETPFPWRPIWQADFRLSHLGRNPDDNGYVGRRIDIMGRSIPLIGGDKESVLAWLNDGSTSASYLIKRPVIGLFPERYLGAVLWSGMISS
ncbi:MAG: hypothetical protein ACLPIX_15980 [Rhodomicrobium sp.]